MVKHHYTNSQLSALIDEHIHSERDRCVLKDRLINGYTYKQISAKYFLSERQVKRIVKKADAILLRM